VLPQRENTALSLVTIKQGRRRTRMDEKLFRSIRLYKNTMAWMKMLLKKGTISDEEYAIIDTKIAEKYGLNSSIIYR
jgi:hypothetical protein